MTNADEVMVVPSARAFARRRVEAASHRPLIVGDAVRDWLVLDCPEVVFPYEGSALVEIEERPGMLRWMWPYRTTMGSRATFAKVTYFEEGRPWWGWHQIAPDRLRTPLSIVYGEIATHNHFVVDRGGTVFNRTAPIIKLPSTSTIEEHFGVAGLLNSSIGCFWMKQVFHDKGAGGLSGGLASESWEHRFAHDSTKLSLSPASWMGPLEGVLAS